MLSLCEHSVGAFEATLFMDKFVARANIEHFRRKLAIETDEAKREVLARLLAEEEAKLATLDHTDPKKRGQDE
jgi:hypothetical protein